MVDIPLLYMCRKLETFIHFWRFKLQTKVFKCIDSISFTGLFFFFFFRQKQFCQYLCHAKHYFSHWLIDFCFLKYAPSCNCCIAITQWQNYIFPFLLHVAVRNYRILNEHNAVKFWKILQTIAHVKSFILKKWLGPSKCLLR